MIRLRNLATATAVGIVLVSIVHVATALGAGTSGGAATIVDPADGTTALTSGGSTTAFTFKLPASPGDRCSADSATGGTFVYSYIAPISQNPADLTFNSDSGPDQAGAFPLRRTNGNGFISVNTAVGTGQVTSFPATQFNFNKFSANASALTDPLPPGQYNVGVACWNSNTNTQDKFWNTALTFTANGTDPRGEVWAAAAGTAPTTTSTAAPGVTTTSTAAGGATSTTRAATTSTTASGVTTTTLSSGSTTSTTRGVTVGASTNTTTAAGNLARSGSPVAMQVVFAGALLYLGALVLVTARRQHWASRLTAMRR